MEGPSTVEPVDPVDRALVVVSLSICLFLLIWADMDTGVVALAFFPAITSKRRIKEQRMRGGVSEGSYEARGEMEE